MLNGLQEKNKPQLMLQIGRRALARPPFCSSPGMTHSVFTHAPFFPKPAPCPGISLLSLL